MAEIELCNFSDLHNDWRDIYVQASGRLLFSSPSWSETWWQHFGKTGDLYLGAVKENGTTIGIAPLRIQNSIAYFIGSNDVCDFLDFIILPGHEKPFFHTLINHFKQLGISTLDLSPLLPGSTVMLFMEEMARNQGLAVTSQHEDVTVYVDLPSQLELYLSSLSSKQRHELLRKERRLNEEGDINFTITGKPDKQQTDAFMRFFRDSREDKKAFLTVDMERFFQSLFEISASEGMLRLGLLELNSQPVAITLCFDHRGEVYLYNSGYDPNYRWLSVGLLSKYYCIKDSIEKGKRRFDFLKGPEKYKYHLGGKEQPIYRCIIKY